MSWGFRGLDGRESALQGRRPGSIPGGVVPEKGMGALILPLLPEESHGQRAW